MLIVADDLTGAADAAGAFAATGHSCVVVLNSATEAENVPTASVVAIDTNGRAMTEDGAFAATVSAVRAHPQRPVFVKIDSTLRGHVRATVIAVLTALETQPTRVVICPAFPARGRTVVDAHVHVDGEPLTGGSLRTAMSGFPPTDGLFIPAAQTNEDLGEIVRSVLRRDDAGAVLWVGSAGLAAHLTGLVESPARPPLALAAASRIGVVVGSQHDGTLHQLAALDSKFQANMHAQVFRIDPRDETYLAQIVPTLRTMNGLVLTGGHTARVVLEALGISSFTVGGEIEPGIPWGITTDPAISLVTKAGGFGDDGVLRRAVEFLHFAGLGGPARSAKA